MPSIRPIEPEDAKDWERMRQTLWPSAPGEHAAEIAAFFLSNRRDPLEVLVALDESGNFVGFIELSIRRYAEGCFSECVAYIEGWFVDASRRRKGIGTALMKAAEEWGRSHGCTELASDTEIENIQSIAAHKSVGFNEVERIVCFKKQL